LGDGLDRADLADVDQILPDHEVEDGVDAG